MARAKHVHLQLPSYDDSFAEHVFSCNRVRLAAPGDLVDQLLADLAPHLSDAAGRNGDHDDAARLADEILRRISDVAC